MDIFENWKPVVGYEGFYEVSDMGRVRSIDRVVGLPGNPRKKLRGKVLRQSAHTAYKSVSLYKNDGTRTGRRRSVHLLVVNAFLGPRPESHEACHNNGDSHDNRLSNLRWDTRAANIEDKKRHGTAWPQPATHCSHGHEMTPANSYYSPVDGFRRCLRCRRDRGLRASAKRTQKRLANLAS